ncbi:MAG: hypothetical protein ACE15C_16795 [Phycisphaerae bacterium]
MGVSTAGSLIANFAAAVGPSDLEHLVESTHGYTGAQVEELASTIHILAVDSSPPARDNDAPPAGISVDPRLIDAALEEVRVERKARLGFHAA